MIKPTITEFISFEFRLVDDSDYQERIESLKLYLQNLGFVESITTSTMVLYNVNNKILVNQIMSKSLHILEDGDVAVIHVNRLKTTKQNGRKKRTRAHEIYYLLGKNKEWKKTTERKFYSLLKQGDLG